MGEGGVGVADFLGVMTMEEKTDVILKETPNSDMLPLGGDLEIQEFETVSRSSDGRDHPKHLTRTHPGKLSRLGQEVPRVLFDI